MSRRSFCYLCATKLDQKSENSWWCSSCLYVQYENPRPCAELILVHDNKILVCERGLEPCKGTYDLPGGFIEFNENTEQALSREIKEELRLSQGDYSTPKYYLSYASEYQFGKETYHNLVTVFMANLLVDPKRIDPQDDVASVRWVGQNEVDKTIWSSSLYIKNVHNALLSIESSDT